MKNPLLGTGSNRKPAANGESDSVGSVSNVDELVNLVRETGSAGDIYENIGVLAAASKAEYGRVRGQLKDATGVNLNQMDAAVREARDELEEKRREKAREARRKEAQSGGGTAVKVTGRRSAAIVDDLREALQDANDPPMWFERENEIVRPRTDEEGRLQIVEVSDPLFDDCLSRCANCVDEKYRPQDPPKRLVDRVAERVELPPLRGITCVPILRPDGTVFSSPGYDKETRQLYRPAGDIDPGSIPEDPTEKDIEKAKEFLLEAWHDHPFDGQASWTNMLALTLTPVVRPLLGDANVPIAIIDAPRAGSGKDLAAQIAALASTGQFPGTMNNPTGDEEWRKQITAQLKRGERFILVSDLTGTLDNAPLRRVLTTPVWSDRILGVSRQVRLPADAVWCATGNNLRPTGDMVRRCYLIRIDSEMERPWTRTDFKHQQPQWAREHRGELAAALLTLACAWIKVGKPEPDIPSLGSFEEWCRVVGGIIQNAGFEDFLGNREELTDTEFSEDNEWSLLLEAFHTWQQESRDGEPFTARELSDSIEAYRKSGMDEEDSLMGPVVQRLPEQVQRKVRREEPFVQSLGKTLAYREDRRFPGGWFLTSEGKGREGTKWTVRREQTGSDSGQSSEPNSRNGSSESGDDASKPGDDPSGDDVFDPTTSPF